MEDGLGNLVGTIEFRQAPAPAGGYVIGLDIAPDGSRMIHWADVWNGYIRDEGETRWRLLLREDNMDEANYTSFPGSPTTDGGIYAARMAPSDPDIIYVSWKGFIFKTTDGGATPWTKLTGFTPREMESNYGAQRRFNRAIDIHPADPDTVIVGTNNNGVYYTTDGGTSWTAVSGLPAALVSIPTMGANGKYLVAFDPGSPNYVYIHVPGTGLYRSSTGVGGAFSLVSGGPIYVACLVVTPAGKVYVCQFRTSATAIPDALKSLDRGGSSWTAYSGTSSADQVAVDPFDPLRLVIVDENAGSFRCSTDGGTTWAASVRYRGDGEVSWLSNRSKAIFPSQLMFDPVVEDKLWMAEGVGIAWSTIPAPTETWYWHDYSRGNAELVPNGVFTSPGNPNILICQDKPFWRMDDPYNETNMWGYPVPAGTAFNESALMRGFSVDYAIDDPSFMVGVAGQNSNIDGYSTNGGRTWVEFANKCAGWAGCVAVSNKNNIIRVPAANAVAQYTLNGGLTWNNVSFGGYSGVTHWNHIYYVLRQSVCADKTTPGTFYALVNNIIPSGYVGVTINIATSTITWPLHSLSNTNRINITTTGSLPTGLTAGTNYYVINKTDNTFQLSLTSGGAAIVFGGTQSGTHTGNLAADTTGRNIAGVWRSIDGGINWTHRFAGVIDTAKSSQFWQATLACVPGFAGELMYADTSGTAACKLWKSTDGAQNWTEVGSGIRNVRGFGFGRAAPGQSRPAVYFFATVDGVTGLYASWDWFATDPILLAERPLNHIGEFGAVSGDLNVFGRCYQALPPGHCFAVCDYAKRWTVTDSTTPEGPNVVPAGDDIFTVMGDSLTPGTGNAEASRDPVLDAPVPGTYHYVNDNSQPDYQQIRSNTAPIWFPSTFSSAPGGRVSPMEAVLRRYQSITASRGRTAAMVPTGVAGSSLVGGASSWDPSIPGSKLVSAKNAHNSAVAQILAARPYSRVRAIIIDLTSNDVNGGSYDTTTIRAAWLGLIDYTRANFDGVDDETVFILGGPAASGSGHNIARVDVAWACTQRVNCYNVNPPVPTADPSNLHPTMPENRIWGAAIADAIFVAPEPTTVSDFSIQGVTGAPLDTPTESGDIIPMVGYGVSVALTVVGLEYRKNGGSWTSSAGTYLWGDVINVRKQSSASYSTLVSGTLNVGGESALFSVTTQAASGTTYNISTALGAAYFDNGRLEFAAGGLILETA